MLTSVEGVYRKGHVELRERPADVPEEAQVIVTFLGPSNAIDLRARGIDGEQARDLRARLAPFAQDWETADMDLYDDYDAAKSKR